MLNKILVIAEGPDDKWLVNRLFETYVKKPVEIVTFSTDIYQLIELYEKTGEDYNDLDIQTLLLENKKGLSPSDKIKLKNSYTDRFLIFDYDRQASRLLEPLPLLEKFLIHFHDSTDMGKLYINYPMLESFRHLNKEKLLANMTDPEFDGRTFSEDDLRKSIGMKKAAYKTRVSTEGYSGKRFSKTQLDIVISQNLCKISKLLNLDIGNIFEQESMIQLLKIQSVNYTEKGKGYVVNTAVTLIPEMYPATFSFIPCK